MTTVSFPHGGHKGDKDMAVMVRREAVATVRVAARAETLDGASWPGDATAVRLADDEVLVLDALETSPPEPDAIVFPDTGWVRFVLTPEAGAELMARAASWPPPVPRLDTGADADADAGAGAGAGSASASALGQGMVAGIPVKLVIGAGAGAGGVAELGSGTEPGSVGVPGGDGPWWFLVPAALADEFEGRLEDALDGAPESRARGEQGSSQQAVSGEAME